MVVKAKEAQGELETVTIEGIEVMAVGTWDGYPDTKTYTKKDLDAMVKSFVELSKAGLHEAPVKLGHDQQQKLIQKDGYPSAGWVSNLRRAGDKLVADFKDVPKKIGEIINSRGYKKVSSEIYYDKELGGKVYPLVLKAVSLLGGDIPAVKTLDDVRALYGEEPGENEQVVTYTWEAEEEVATLDEILAGIDGIFSKAEGAIKGKSGSPAIRTYLKEVKTKLKTLLGKETSNKETYSCECIKCGYKSQTEQHCADYTCPECGGQMRRLERPGIGQSAEDGNSIGQVTDSNNENKNKEAVMLAELRKVLVLGEDASESDALAVVKDLKAKAEGVGETVSLEEHQSLSAKVVELTNTLAESKRDTMVADAIRVGKITPAQKENYDKLALDNPVLFAELMEKQPVVVSLKELGAGDGEAEAVELTEQERTLGAQLGVSEEELIEQKKKDKEAVR